MRTTFEHPEAAAGDTPDWSESPSLSQAWSRWQARVFLAVVFATLPSVCFAQSLNARSLAEPVSKSKVGSQVNLDELHLVEEGSHNILGRASRSKVVFFTATDSATGGSTEIFRTDGTSAGTFRISGLRPLFSLVVGDRLLWSAVGTDSIDIWTSDGSPSGSVRILELPSPNPLFGPFPFFMARESATSPQGHALYVREDFDFQEPWITDGTEAGTRQLLPGVQIKRVLRMLAGRGQMFLLTESLGGVTELWRTGYGPSTPVRVWQGVGAGGPSMVLAGDELLFMVLGQSESEPSQLFRSDGTVAGTGAIGVLPELNTAKRSFFVDPFAYFLVSDPRGEPSEIPLSLWRSKPQGPAEKLLDLGEESDLFQVDGLTVLADSVFPEAVSMLWTILEQGEISAIAACLPSCGWNGNLGSTGSKYQFLLWGPSSAVAFVTDGTFAETRHVWIGSLGTLQMFDVVSFGEAESIFVLGPSGDPNEPLLLQQLGEEGKVVLRDFGTSQSVSPPSPFLIEDDGSAVFAVQERQGGSALYAVAAVPEPCTPSPTVLCLGQGRFEVQVEWTDFDGGAGEGQVRELTEDTGSFWFFTQENLELIVKVVDGTPINNHHWVFYGSLSDVGYRMTVTDTRTGRRRVYENSSGTFASRGDVEALLGDSAEVTPKPGPALRPPAWAQASASQTERLRSTSCAATAQALCLVDRFSVSVRWTDFSGGRGEGTTLELTPDTGGFWFFDSENVELVVKVLDGRPVNGKFWVFYGALSDVAYELEVTDTQTGTVRVYSNSAGKFGSRGDIEAFDG